MTDLLCWMRDGFVTMDACMCVMYVVSFVLFFVWSMLAYA